MSTSRKVVGMREGIDYVRCSEGFSLRDWVLGITLMLACIALVAPSVANAGLVPYGPAPQSLTWSTPPTVFAHVTAERPYHVPNGVTDLDVWLNAYAWDETRTPYRLRQRVRRYGYCFTRARSRRCIATYRRATRTLTVRKTVRRLVTFYGWEA